MRSGDVSLGNSIICTDGPVRTSCKDSAIESHKLTSGSSGGILSSSRRVLGERGPPLPAYGRWRCRGR